MIKSPLSDVSRVLNEFLSTNQMNETLVQLKCESHTPQYSECLGVSFRTLNTGLLDKDPLELKDILKLVDLSLSASEQNLMDQSIPLMLIEDTLDALTIHSASELFDYLESRVSRLTFNMQSTKGKGLVLLRFCNELLRRMPKTKNADMCGRILTFISNVFPLTERSGVNLKGQFNVDNITTYDDDQDGNEMDVDEDDPTQPKEKTKADTKFYKTFWSAQKYLSNPIEVCNEKGFESFIEITETIISKFERILELEKSTGSGSGDRKEKKRSGEKSSSLETKPESSQGSATGSSQTSSSINGSSSGVVTDSAKHEHFFPKFLTSQNLFGLELEDPSFRRQILTQYAIIFQFLISLSPEDKAKLAKTYEAPSGPAPTLNRFVQHTYTLTPDQEKFILESRIRIFKLLEKTGGGSSSGKSFFKTLWTILAHEKNWIRWKLENCSSYEKSKMDIVDGVKRARADASLATRQGYLGTNELTRLWDRGRDVNAALKERAKRSKVVTIDKHLQELDYQVEEDGETLAEGMEDASYVLYNSPRFNWLAYRTAARQDLVLFGGVVEINSAKAKDVKHKAPVSSFSHPGKTLLLAWRKDRNPPLTDNTDKGDTEATDPELASQTLHERDSPIQMTSTIPTKRDVDDGDIDMISASNSHKKFKSSGEH